MLIFPHEYQLGTNDCGPVCIKIIAKYYGKIFSLQYLRNLCCVNHEGVSLLNLGKAFEDIGLNTISFKLNFEELQKIKLPVILHWKTCHFIVVYKISKGKIFVSDPAKGLVKYDVETFKLGWLGNNRKWAVLALEPMDDFNQRPTY